MWCSTISPKIIPAMSRIMSAILKIRNAVSSMLSHLPSPKILIIHKRHKGDKELQNTLYTISDTVNLLTEEVEILRDELEHIDDSSIQEDRPEILDSQ